MVREHLDRHDLCALVTATNSFVTAPIVREFGIEHLIATEPEERDGNCRIGQVDFAAQQRIWDMKFRGERPLYLMYDQIYWMLRFGDTPHFTPPELLPEMARYTLFVDGLGGLVANLALYGLPLSDLATYGDEAKVLAGGQSLIPAMNFRLAQPSLLVDINRLAELDFVRSLIGYQTGSEPRDVSDLSASTMAPASARSEPRSTSSVRRCSAPPPRPTRSRNALMVTAPAAPGRGEDQMRTYDPADHILYVHPGQQPAAPGLLALRHIEEGCSLRERQVPPAVSCMRRGNRVRRVRMFRPVFLRPGRDGVTTGTRPLRDLRQDRARRTCLHALTACDARALTHGICLIEHDDGASAAVGVADHVIDLYLAARAHAPRALNACVEADLDAGM